MIISVFERFGEFAENKNKAKNVRTTLIEPSIKNGNTICLDFKGVNNATQSFIHALISNLIRIHGIEALEKIEFKNCNETLKTIITIVVDYMQDSLENEEDENEEDYIE